MQTQTAIYTRISRDREGAGLGVARQEKDCRELAAKLGWHVVRVYSDNDISAYSGKPRPGYLAMVEDIKAGLITGVIAWHTDRLHRNNTELESYISLEVETHTVKAGLIDLATPAGRMIARQLGAVAQYESEHRADRAKRKKIELATSGQYMGGPRPFGYEKDGMTIRPEEAHELQQAVKSLLAGASLASVLRDWNERGITSTRGNRWHDSSLRAVILRDRNAGLLRHQGKVIGKAAWEPIISETDHLAVTSLLRDPSRRTSPGAARVHLLSGLVVCGVCGKTMHTKINAGRNRKRYSVYVCCVTRIEAKVDEYVVKWVKALLSDERIIRGLSPQDKDTKPLEAEREALTTRLDEAASLYSSGAISSEQLANISRDLLARREAVTESLAASARGTVLEDIDLTDIDATWDRLTIERKQRIIEALMTVRILPLGQVGRRVVPISEGVAVKLHTDKTPGIRTKVIGGPMPKDLQRTLANVLA